ncbi:MAG: ABC transporter permease subunit [Clostridia bacterium]|nr:ABC transporter permease subunit [Clostridia bacterium]
MKIKKTLLRAAMTIAALVFWVLIWHLLAAKVALPFVLPAPLEVGRLLWGLAGEADFYRTLLSSFLRVISGFGGGLLLGFGLGMLSHFAAPVRILLSPLMAAVKATPVASFILVVLFWMERQEVPAFISLAMVLPIVYQNTLLGFEKRDGALTEMARIFRISPLRRFFRIDLPQVVGFVISAGKTALGLSWKAGIAAEVLALPKASVGYMIYNAKMYLETGELYAWTVAIVLFSVILEKLFVFLCNRLGGAIHASGR